MATHSSVLAWSPPGSPVPGILQARTLEWAAIYGVAQVCVVQHLGKGQDAGWGSLSVVGYRVCVFSLLGLVFKLFLSWQRYHIHTGGKTVHLGRGCPGSNLLYHFPGTLDKGQNLCTSIL